MRCRCIASASNCSASGWSSRTTLATWMVRVGELVVPLINVLRDELVGAILEEHVPVDVKVQRRAPTRRWALLQPTASDALRTSVTSM